MFEREARKLEHRSHVREGIPQTFGSESNHLDSGILEIIHVWAIGEAGQGELGSSRTSHKFE